MSAAIELKKGVMSVLSAEQIAKIRSFHLKQRVDAEKSGNKDLAKLIGYELRAQE